MESPNVALTNEIPPSDGRLSEVRQMRLSKVTQAVASVLALGGHPIVGTPADGSDAPTMGKSPGRERLKGITVKTLLDAGLLAAGETLIPSDYQRWTDPVVVQRDGTLMAANGERYGAPSAAARVVTGRKAERGWDFWKRSNGLTLDDTREEFLQSKNGHEGLAPPTGVTAPICDHHPERAMTLSPTGDRWICSASECAVCASPSCLSWRPVSG